MDITSTGSSRSAVLFSRIKRVILLIAFIGVIGLEIYISLFISIPTSGVSKLNIDKFSCAESFKVAGTGGVGSSLRLKICNRLINIFKSVNRTQVGEVTLTEEEWTDLDSLLRR